MNEQRRQSGADKLTNTRQRIEREQFVYVVEESSKYCSGMTLKSHEVLAEHGEGGCSSSLAIPLLRRGVCALGLRNYLDVVDGLITVDERCTLKFPYSWREQIMAGIVRVSPPCKAVSVRLEIRWAATCSGITAREAS